MANNSPIEWTDATWNPITGCNKISPGCKHCYAERMSNRLQAMGQNNYANGFALTLQPQMLEHPLHWRKSRRIFVNSMSDLFHADVPVDYIQQVFDVMRRAHWHQYQVLTKRSERLLELTEHNVMTQMKNLRSHPSVAARLAEGDLSLHGWVYQNIFKHFGLYFGSLLGAVTFMLFCWLIGYFLDKKKIYVRV